LKDGLTAEKIISPLRFCKGQIVEIGAGCGILSGYILKISEKRPLLIEIDKTLATFLKKEFGEKADVENVNFEDFDLARLGEKTCFAGNLPYHCSTAILEKVLFFDRWTAACFMFQKEVAQRICAEVSERRYSYISIMSSLMSERRIFLEVSRKKFSPPPKVDSAVVFFRRKESPLNIKEMKIFLNFVGGIFRHRRKTVANSLFLSLGMPKERIFSILKRLDIPPLLRPQNVSPQDYLRLYAEIRP